MDIHYILLAAAEAATEHAATAAESAEAASTSPIGALGIDWRLFIAQLVNFGIVLLIFWKWVVKPLGKTLTDRQEKIESGLKNATYMEDEKLKFEDWKTKEMQKVRVDAERVLKTASETAEGIKQETISTAQSQANKLVEQAKASITSEKEQMLKDVRSSVAELVVMASEKIIKTKLDAKKDQELVQTSVKEAI